MKADPAQQPSDNDMRAFACRLLGRREYSVYELRRRLQKKWPQTPDVDDLIRRLEEENLVSDHRYAESFVRSRIQRQQGPRKIKAELRAHGVADILADEALQTAAVSWPALAGEWLERQQAGEITFGDKQKFYRRLVNRGFTHDQAMDAVNRTRQETD